jgi:uncharacterized protein
MLAFDLLKKWMPYAHNYCWQRGKQLTVSITTNMTIFDEEHLEWFRFWGVGIHCSIDGIPEVQDRCRVFPDGTGSSEVVERNLPRIFAAWRTVHARSTIVPETVSRLFESYQYFCEKGFLKIAFALANSNVWGDADTLDVLSKNIVRILDAHMERMKKEDRYFVVNFADEFTRRVDLPRIGTHCGAGRGLLHVDAEGFLWPCHRFNGIEPREEFVIGHVDGGFHPPRKQAFLHIVPGRDMKMNCQDCEAASYCGCPCIAANWQTNGDLFDPGDGYCKAVRVMYHTIKGKMEDIKQSDSVFYGKYCDWVSNYKW